VRIREDIMKNWSKVVESMNVEEFKEILGKYKKKLVDIDKDVEMLKGRKVVLLGVKKVQMLVNILNEQLQLEEMSDDVNLICSSIKT
jgi:biotin-(acetyl-CoA carboxylase) ligase